MAARKLLGVVITAGTFAAGALVITAARRGPALQIIDFHKVVTRTTPAYDAALPPVSDAAVKEFVIPIRDARLQIADGVTYDGWTFGGTVPGPTIHVREGDRVRIVLENETQMPHSIDFHAARIPANVAYRTINPGDTLRFEFTARDPGAYLVHCGTAPTMMHIAQGMYMAIIVDPKGGWGTKADKEFVIVQSEFYAKPDSAGGPEQLDWQGALDRHSAYVVFNGRAFQYKDHPLKVDVGDRVRFYVINAGPNFDSDFHVVGAIFDRVYPDGDPRHALDHVQTQLIPAGGAAVLETVFARDGSGEGIYPFVTHAFADATKGAVGMIQVGTPTQYAHMDH